MTGTESNDRDESIVGDGQCPACGGKTIEAGGTQAYTYVSCVECEWYEKVKTGSYR